MKEKLIMNNKKVIINIIILICSLVSFIFGVLASRFLVESIVSNFDYFGNIMSFMILYILIILISSFFLIRKKKIKTLIIVTMFFLGLIAGTNLYLLVLL